MYEDQFKKEIKKVAIAYTILGIGFGFIIGHWFFPKTNKVFLSDEIKRCEQQNGEYSLRWDSWDHIYSSKCEYTDSVEKIRGLYE